MDGSSIAVGFGLGVFATAGAAYVGIRRYVQQVRSAERRARSAERMAEIGAMTGGLAHEIRNPLSTIGLNAGLLVESISDLEVPDPERQRLLNRTRGLQRETERLAEILQDFLAYAGKVHLERRTADVNVVVGELVDFYLPEAERQGVRIRSEPTPDRAEASIDVRLFKQAVLNLMINACQAMAQARAQRTASGGTAGELILRVERSRRAKADGRGSDPTVRVHVIDTGPGISPETLASIFNPYFTTKPGGSGLGLPMSRRLIEAHSGQIAVHSEPGRGSDFTIEVPVAAESAADGN